MIYFFGEASYNDRDKFLKHLRSIMEFDLKDLFLQLVNKGDNRLLEDFVETFILEWLDRIEAGEILKWKGIKIYVRNYQA